MYTGAMSTTTKQKIVRLALGGSAIKTKALISIPPPAIFTNLIQGKRGDISFFQRYHSFTGY